VEVSSYKASWKSVILQGNRNGLTKLNRFEAQKNAPGSAEAVVFNMNGGWYQLWYKTAAEGSRSLLRGINEGKGAVVSRRGVGETGGKLSVNEAVQRGNSVYTIGKRAQWRCSATPSPPFRPFYKKRLNCR